MWITRRPVAENLLLLSPAELTSRSSFHRPVRGLFPLGAVQRMWKKPVKSPDVTTVFVSPFKENSTLRCSYTVIYLHSVVFCAFQEIIFFFWIKRGNFIWLSFMSGIISLHEPRRLCNNPERTSVILHLHKAVGYSYIWWWNAIWGRSLLPFLTNQTFYHI